VYFIHPPILVGLTLAFHSLPISPLAHIALLTVAGLGLSFFAADLLRRVPGLKSIF
jgi:hypothetical protein